MPDIDLPDAPVLPIIDALEKVRVHFILVAGYARRERGDPRRAIRAGSRRRSAWPFSLKEVADGMRETSPRKHPSSSSLETDPGEEESHHLGAVGLAEICARLKPIRQLRGVIAGGESKRYPASL